MGLVRGIERSLVLSLFTKEASYNAGTAFLDANACLMHQHISNIRSIPDEMAVDDDTESEFPTLQEINMKKFAYTYSENKAKPNSMAGLIALALGGMAVTQDGGFTAYRHDLTPVAPGTELESISSLVKEGGSQYQYDGIIGNSFKVSGSRDNGFIALESELMGSGKRATNGAAVPSKISEVWMAVRHTKAWLETGANISINGSPAQGAQGISSGTPEDLKIRLRDWEFTWNNNFRMNPGWGADYTQQATYGPRRSAAFKFTLDFDTADLEFAYYLAQDPVAFEIDCTSQTVIDAGGSYKYGFKMVIPKMQLKPPEREGGFGDYLTEGFPMTILDDGVNPVVKFHIYNGKSAYLG